MFITFTVVNKSEAGQYVVSASYDKTVRLWNPFSNKLIKVYRGHGYQVVDVAV
jgi:WD40 repeat protein